MPARRVHFNKLPEPVRQRFVDAVAGGGEPRPILRISSGGRWWAGPAAFLGAVATIGAWAIGLGDLDSGLSSHGVWGILVFGLLLSLTLTAALIALADRLGKRALPFAQGRFLFPTDLVEAHGPVLVIRSLSGLRKMQPKGAFIHLDFGDHKVSLPVVGADSAREIIGQLQAAAELRASDLSPEEAKAFDVFYGFRDTPGWRSPNADPPPEVGHGPVVGAFPSFLTKPALFGVALGLVAAFPVHLARDAASDTGRYEAAVADGKLDALMAYLEVGGSYEDEIRDEHMPMAAYKVARQRGTIKEMRAFITGEWADDETRRLARAYIGKAFTRAYDRFLLEASSNTEARVLVKDLLDWLEREDSPPVEVRFRAPSADALETLDSVIARAAERTSDLDVAEVAPWFTPDASEAREATIAQGLARGFGRVFPGDVLSIEHGPRLTDEEGAETFGYPTIEVMYVISPRTDETGVPIFYARDKKSRQFVGIAMAFDVQIHVPGREPYAFDMVVEPPETFSVDRSVLDAADERGKSSEGVVYEIMARRAFDMLAGRMADAFFRDGGAAISAR